MLDVEYPALQCALQPIIVTAQGNPIPEAILGPTAILSAPPETPLPGQGLSETQNNPAGQPISEAKAELLTKGETPPNTQSCALVGEITAVYRRYDDLRRARQRIDLQAMATCRNVCGGDKVAGAKLYKKPTPEVGVWLIPYQAAMAPLDAAIAEQAKLLDKLGKRLPVQDWIASVSGLSPRFLAMIVGECGIGPGEFKSVSALWKRMGLAVIDGGRQRRVSGDAAIKHGYVARRRSLMWNIGESIIKQQVRNPKGDDGKPIGDPFSRGEFGGVYLARKVIETVREGSTPMHAHNRAKRYMEKRLLRELWKAWRRI